MSEVVDNSIEYNPKSVQLYNNIREYAAAGYSKREIVKILHCGRNTVQSPSILMATMNPYAKEITGAAWINFMMIL